MSETQTPEQRTAAAMRDIEAACRLHGVRIVTQINVETTKVGDRAIVGSEWAIAPLKEWSPPGPDEFM